MDPIAAYRKQQERLGQIEKSLGELRNTNPRWAAIFDRLDADDDKCLSKDEAEKAFSQVMNGSDDWPKFHLRKTFDEEDKDEAREKCDFRQFSKIVRIVSAYMDDPKWRAEEADQQEQTERLERRAERESKQKEVPDLDSILGLNKPKKTKEQQLKDARAARVGGGMGPRSLSLAGGIVMRSGSKVAATVAKDDSALPGNGGTVTRSRSSTFSLARRHASLPEAGSFDNDGMLSPTTAMRSQWNRFDKVDNVSVKRRQGAGIQSSKEVKKRQTIDIPADLPQMKLGGPAVACMATRFTEDGSLLAGGFFDGGLRIYDVDEGKMMHCLNLPRSKGGTVKAPVETTETLMAEMYAKGGTFEEGQEYRPMDLMKANTEAAVTNLRWAPGGSARSQMLATIDTSGSWSLWEIAKSRSHVPKCITKFDGQGLGLDAVCFPCEAGQICMAGSEKVVKVYDIESQVVKLELGSAAGLPGRISGHNLKIVALCGHPSNPNVIFSGGIDRKVLVWDMRQEYPCGVIHGPELSGDALDITADGNTLLTGSHRTSTPLQMHELRMKFGPVKRIGSKQSVAPLSRPTTPGLPPIPGAARPGSSGGSRMGSKASLTVSGPPQGRVPEGLAAEQRARGTSGSRQASPVPTDPVSQEGPLIIESEEHGKWEWRGDEEPFDCGAKPTSCLIIQASFDSSGKTIVACGEKEHLARVYERPETATDPLRVSGTFFAPRPFLSAAITRDGRNAAFGNEDGSILLVDVRARRD
jgi:WD40 repeat protein